MLFTSQALVEGMTAVQAHREQPNKRGNIQGHQTILRVFTSSPPPDPRAPDNPQRLHIIITTPSRGTRRSSVSSHHHHRTAQGHQMIISVFTSSPPPRPRAPDDHQCLHIISTAPSKGSR
ncbi:hypothetical protein P7K49_020581 [Saguinus oedipus]|uniref:Uncharacterized protein n=1 Tax=Saguinus oedipus TaxID=9490 RepID=A0ABQ9V0P0_SAGOE|nr:hypothetical protein P7K49_020581 [Saguinus oedipus]